MYVDVVLNGLPLTVSGNYVEIYDPLHDVTDTEARIIVNYLYDEGFINETVAHYNIIRDDL